jgi:hypothetical protein
MFVEDGEITPSRIVGSEVAGLISVYQWVIEHFQGILNDPHQIIGNNSAIPRGSLESLWELA